jgi:hypothetical protein
MVDGALAHCHRCSALIPSQTDLSGNVYLQFEILKIMFVCYVLVSLHTNRFLRRSERKFYESVKINLAIEYASC